jgi:two-component system, OmpR family, response regulator
LKDTVLIVDDSTFIVEGLVALLKKTYLPVPSYGGEECLAILRTLKPSIIILDIMMEPMDGWETLARIKENPATRHIPVLMFSAKKISPEEAEAHRIIIDDFITKPVNPKKLLEAIEKVLARQEFNRQIIRNWNEAGVSPDIIDEYLTLKTNLDVDASLLAVMKKQLDIAYPDAVNRDDLEHSIAALEVRIGLSRSRIEVFCREKAGILPVPDRESGGLLPHDLKPDPVPARPASEPDPETPTLQRAGEPVHPPEYEVPAAEHQPPVTGPGPEPRQTGPEPVPVPGTLTAIQSEDDGEAPAAAPPSLPAPKAPVLHPPPGPKPDLPRGASPPAAAYEPETAGVVAGHREITPGGNAPAGEAIAQPDNPGTRPLSDLFEPEEPVRPEHDEPDVVDKSVRKTPPSRPRADAEELSYPPGAGTETPRMRAGETTSRELKWELEQKEIRQSRQPAPSGNIISRIIAAISALFKKKDR